MTDDLHDLHSEERILMVAWPLPNDGELSDAQRKQAMDNFAGYVRGRGLSHSDVARAVGNKPGATAIYELVHGTFRSSSDDYIRKLNNWIEQHARASSAKIEGRFVATTKVAREILTVARLIRENRTIGLVFGPTGVGKTACAQAVHEKFVGSVLVTIIPGYHSPSGLTRAIGRSLGHPVRGPGHTSVERVVDTLRDSGRLVIIDEAHRLTDAALDLLRSIHDVAGVPMMLLATRALHDRIVKNADPDGGQLYSRFDIVLALTEGQDVYSGGKQLHTIDDIRALYNEPGLRLDKSAEQYLLDVANALGFGSLRRCRMLVQNAARRARKRLELAEGESVTITGVDLEWVESRLRRERGEQLAAVERRRIAAGAGAN